MSYIGRMAVIVFVLLHIPVLNSSDVTRNTTETRITANGNDFINKSWNRVEGVALIVTGALVVVLGVTWCICTVKKQRNIAELSRSGRKTTKSPSKTDRTDKDSVYCESCSASVMSQERKINEKMIKRGRSASAGSFALKMRERSSSANRPIVFYRMSFDKPEEVDDKTNPAPLPPSHHSNRPGSKNSHYWSQLFAGVQANKPRADDAKMIRERLPSARSFSLQSDRQKRGEVKWKPTPSTTTDSSNKPASSLKHCCICNAPINDNSTEYKTLSSSDKPSTSVKHCYICHGIIDDSTTDNDKSSSSTKPPSSTKHCVKCNAVVDNFSTKEKKFNRFDDSNGKEKETNKVNNSHGKEKDSNSWTDDRSSSEKVTTVKQIFQRLF